MNNLQGEVEPMDWESASVQEQQFLAPGTFQKLRCYGRPCVKCKKCRDWKYSGNSTDLNRIRNIILTDDKNGWNAGSNWNDFHRRNGAECIHSRYYGARFNNLDDLRGDRGHCLCLDNCKVKLP